MPAARAPIEPQVDALIGREILGQYVVRRRLGEGGMGEVYLADQPAFGRTAVIKVLSRAGASRGDGAARFHLEAKAVSRLKHPNIVTVYNAGELEDGTLYLAMEHVEGKSLQEVVRREAPLAPARAVGIARQIADALAEAHRRGVIHRDLKPSNVMLVLRRDDVELVKLLDFGIAKLEGVDLTRTGIACGTPVYMSPEQFNGQKLDGRADLYALGAVLFEMLVGKPPFESDSVVGYMAKHLTEPPRVPPHVPAPLAALLLAALAKDPDDRPASLEAFRRALDAALSGGRGAAPTEEMVLPARAAATAMTAVRAPDVARSSRLGATWPAFTRWVATSARALWAATAGRLRPRPPPPPTLVGKVTGWLETVGLKRRLTWRERTQQRLEALFRRSKRRR
jgi:serine/threonine-protein kinase